MGDGTVGSQLACCVACVANAGCQAFEESAVEPERGSPERHCKLYSQGAPLRPQPTVTTGKLGATSGGETGRR